MLITEIIRELEYFKGYYPEKALREAIDRKEEVIPELIKVLEKSIANISYIRVSKRNNGFIYAFYLLALFREKSAFPFIAEFFSKLKGNPYDFTGVLVTETLARILASVFNGELATLNFITTCDEYDEFVRIAFFDTYLILYKNDMISREELIREYQKVFENLVRKKSYLWYNLIDACAKAGIKELMENIKQAYEDNLIDTVNLPYEETMDDINSGFSKNYSSKYTTLIDDVIAETNWWSCYSKKQEEHGFYAGMPENAKEIIKELAYFQGSYPEDALIKAAKNKDVIIPELLKLLDWTSQNPQDCEDIDFIGPVLACYLLGQFQEKSAFPVIIRFITSGVYSEETLFEFVLINLSEILASCYNGDFSLLIKNILNSKIPEAIRASFLECLIILFKFNEIKKTEFIETLKMLISNLERNASDVWNYLIEACKLSKATELFPEIELAYKEELIDEDFYPFKETREVIYGIRGKVPDFSFFQKFDSEIISTDWWEGIELYQPEEIHLSYRKRMKNFVDTRSDDDIDEEEFDDEDYLPMQTWQPYVREGKKIGRNDPCPCGSGKKFKKCCGRDN
ncbi:MAG: DUF1186 domain-containing protein [Candidatus Cloacimonetes bacterium]|nr:DUF1186 domain-containing protein [Candidatus Cloacimonadota bacterium]